MPKLCHGYCSETEMQSLSDVSTLTIIVWFTFIIFEEFIRYTYFDFSFSLRSTQCRNCCSLWIHWRWISEDQAIKIEKKKGENKWII